MPPYLDLASALPASYSGSLMADIKLQVYRGELPPEHVDFRGDGFKGSPEDEHRTILEYREDDPAEIEALKEDLPALNRRLARFAAKQGGRAGDIAKVLGLGGSGPVKVAGRIYEND